MKEIPKPVFILVAGRAFQLTRDVLLQCHMLNETRTVADGEELMEYLNQGNSSSDLGNAPLPDLILLDVNLPKKDVRQCLQEIRADARLKAIPVLALTATQAEEDVLRSYQLGVDSFIRKPVTLAALADAVLGLGRYWFEMVEVPGQANAGEAR